MFLSTFEKQVDAKRRIVVPQEFRALISGPFDGIVCFPSIEADCIEGGGRAVRYGIAVGRDGQRWTGEAVVGRMARWPSWTPTANMRRRNPNLPQRVAGGPQNPLGARAIYLYRDGRDTLYRIHGTNEPWSIGNAASSGCIRMLNEHVLELFGTVRNGARVIVL